MLSEPYGLCSVQELPGRLGYWDVGVPPSGPMDVRSFIASNRLVGNPDETAALEIAQCGAALQFDSAGLVALAGAPLAARLNGDEISFYTAIAVKTGDILKIGTRTGLGMRAYLAVRGGLDAPEFMGSRATFVRGALGSVLRKGARLSIGIPSEREPELVTAPALSETWEIEVRVGPHGLPEYIEPAELKRLLNAEWTVSQNLDRSGVRLEGPSPKWTRENGGVAGLNPSNIMDTPYSVGAVNFMGDTPVITSVDGPSLGGFCTLFCVESSDLWKVGQLVPGNRVKFKVLSELAELGHIPLKAYSVRYLSSGDRGLLVEYGPESLDLELRMRVFMLREAIDAKKITGVRFCSPGVRGLLVEFDPILIGQSALMENLKTLERRLCGLDYPSIPARRVRLPLSWEDPAVVLAVQRYMQTIGNDAEYCPDNIEFVRKINGFESKEALKKKFFETRFVVLGLGDVYMGAPLAVALNPDDRLRSTKYNPARTWTPEGAVGLGGQYLCIYGMESPGGYQLMGRTLPTWKPDREKAGNQFFWFDELTFYEVSAEKLEELTTAFRANEFEVETESMWFDWACYKDKR